MSKARNVTAILQEEEASDSWSLFAFAYNQWLCKARMMVSKTLEQQHDRAKKEGGNFPDDMTDQVSTENNVFLHYNCVTCFCQYFTFELLRDPVVAADGFTYERESIEQWFAQGNHRSPKTGAHLQNKLLFPNHDLRAAIHEWCAGGDNRAPLAAANVRV